MRSRFLVWLTVAALLWAQPSLAAIGTPTNIGAGNAGAATVTTLDAVTTLDSPAGVAIIGVLNTSTSTTALGVTDSAGNSYTVSAKYAGGGGGAWMYYIGNPVDLPAPCTVTATETTTTLVVTAVVTCSSTDALTVGQTISGGSFTGKISAPCTLVAGAATCTITGGATVASPATATISSTITATWSTASKAGMGVISVSGLTTTPLDLTGAGTSTGSPGTNIATGAGMNVPAAGSLGQANEILIARLDAIGPTSGFTQGGGGTWLPLTKVVIASGNGEINWAYQIVASTVAVLWNPSWTTSRAFGANYYTFKAPSTATACRLSLMGVGSC